MVMLLSVAVPLLKFVAPDAYREDVIDLGLTALRISAASLPGLAFIAASTGVLLGLQELPRMTIVYGGWTLLEVVISVSILLSRDCSDQIAAHDDGDYICPEFRLFMVEGSIAFVVCVYGTAASFAWVMHSAGRKRNCFERSASSIDGYTFMRTICEC